jgi:hypothetical protein
MLWPERLRTIHICASLSTVMLCCKAVYGGRLWRPVLSLEFARLVHQSLGTSALFLSYVFVEIIIIIIILQILCVLFTESALFSLHPPTSLDLLVFTRHLLLCRPSSSDR